MTDPNQYNPQNPQQAQQYGGYGSYGQNDYGQQAPQYGALNTAHRNTAMRPDTTSSSRNTAHRNLSHRVRQLLRTDRSARPAGLQLHHRRGVHPLLEKVRHVQGPRLPRRILVVGSVHIHHPDRVCRHLRGVGRHHRQQYSQWNAKLRQHHLGTGNDCSIPCAFRSPPARHQQGRHHAGHPLRD